MSEADRAKWDARWRERADGPEAPEPFLVRALAALPTGPLLDVAAGDGRNALWLAGRGFAVTAVDVSPVAIARLEAAAEMLGLDLTARTRRSRCAGGSGRARPLRAALVVVRFKPSPAQWRPLLDSLRPGGRVLLCSFGREQHRRHGFPLAFCLERGAVEAELTPGLRLLDWQSYEEDGACLEGSLWEKAPAAAALP